MAEKIPSHRFMKMLRSARRFEEKWRKNTEVCFQYCDGEQWTADELFAIESRGQQPTVINTILPTVDMVCAVANDKQGDVQVIGREESDDSKAVLMTALLKQVMDSCNYDYYQRLGFREALISGRSWFECSVFTDDRGKDLVKVDLIPFENVYLDPFSRKPDASDARYIIKVKWVDRDVAKKLFPDAAELIDNTFVEDYKGQEYEAQMNSQDRGEAFTPFYYDTKSNRVRICECYYTVPEAKEVEVLNERTGKKEKKTINKNVMHYVIFSDEIILQGSATSDAANVNPLKIDCFPLVPMYCTKDRKGLPRGIVSSLIDIQDQINKLNSKFLWTLMANRLIMEEGAVKDPDATREEYQKPDGLVIVNENCLGKIKTDEKYRDLSYMSNHLSFLLATEQRISGVNDSMLGLGGTNERSGIMQATRISQGASMQTCILENMFFSKQRLAYVILKLIGAYYTDYRIMRITQPNGMSETYEFNKPEYEIDPVTGKKKITRIFNEIEDTLYYDVTLKHVPPFSSLRERMLQIFSEVLKTGVIPAPIAGKMMLLLSDMPNKENLIMELENFYQAQQQAAQMTAQQGGMM